MPGMDTVSIRDLRNHGGKVVDRVALGESVIIARDGKPVAELHPIRKPSVTLAQAIRSRKALLRVDVKQFRQDIDQIMDMQL